MDSQSHGRPITIIVIVSVLAFVIWYMTTKRNPVSEVQPSALGCNITSDPTTWPSGDRIWLICHAVAMAEGAQNSGEIPDRANNPGDISDGWVTYGGFNIDSKVTQFPDKQTGWSYLYNKWANIIAGNSIEYSANDSWNTIASKWAGDWKSWVTNVTNVLGVDPNSTVAQYMAS